MNLSLFSFQNKIFLPQEIQNFMFDSAFKIISHMQKMIMPVCPISNLHFTCHIIFPVNSGKAAIQSAYQQQAEPQTNRSTSIESYIVRSTAQKILFIQLL